MRRIHIAPWLILAAIAATTVVHSRVNAQPATWTGAVNGNWNTAGNWSPVGIPNSLTSDVIFSAQGAGIVTISASVAVHSLTFDGFASSFTLTATAGQILNGLTAITLASNNTSVQTINLPTVSSGSLLFTGSGAGALTIANNDQGTQNPSLTIGPSTVIGTAGFGGITITGSGTTQISGSFASGANAVVGGLTKTGGGTLIISGDASNLQGSQNGGASVVFSGGYLQLDYSTNTANKLGGGSLSVGGGFLSLVSNAVTPINQTVAGSTTILNGLTFLEPSTNHGALANLTLNLGAITRAGSGTLDIDPDTNTVLTTNSPLTNGILGGFVTFNEKDWASRVGNSIVALGSPGAPFLWRQCLFSRREHRRDNEFSTGKFHDELTPLQRRRPDGFLLGGQYRSIGRHSRRTGEQQCDVNEWNADDAGRHRRIDHQRP